MGKPCHEMGPCKREESQEVVKVVSCGQRTRSLVAQNLLGRHRREEVFRETEAGGCRDANDQRKILA